ncbi:MAG: radical SAM protein [Patescibacteria group bacterium]
MLKKFIGRLFYIIPAKPNTAQIAVTNICNFNCPMCQRFDLKVDIKHMEAQMFEQILEKIKDVPNIILTSWGEPLTHPQLFDFIKKSAKSHKVRLTSNGALLDETKAQELLISGLDAITFSVDTLDEKESYGHPLKEQIKNIEYFAKLNFEAGTPVKIFLQTVFLKYDKNNFHEIVEFAKKNKINRIRLTRVDQRFNDYARPSQEEEKKLVKFLEKELKGSKVGLDFLPYVAFDGLFRIIFKIVYPLLHRFGKFCLRTFDDVYINERGEVTPCCSLPNLNCGNILESDLQTIWQSEKFKNFRQNQEKYCGKCDILKIKIK